MTIPNIIKRLLRSGTMGTVLVLLLLPSGEWRTVQPGRLIPEWVVLAAQQETVCMRTEAGEEQIMLSLADGRLRLGEVYSSDAAWLVADVLIGDVDRDGVNEVLLHVWKPGSFGEYHPFWLEEVDEESYSEHLFLYEWDMQRQDRLDPKWMSSAMPVEGLQVSLAENGDVCILSPDSSRTVWRWEGWGLFLVS